MKHTPAPWFIDWNAAQGGEGHYITDKDNVSELSRIAVVLFHDDTDGETKANARLIAAAPELLEALRGTTERLDAWADMHGVKLDAKLVRDAKAAIAKATGGAA